MAGPGDSGDRLGTVQSLFLLLIVTKSFSGIALTMLSSGLAAGIFKPPIAGTVRAISWNRAFVASAVAIGVMLLITIFFYREPPRERSGETLGKELRDIVETPTDVEFAVFLALLGIFLFAVGEMITSPRIQESITWIAGGFRELEKRRGPGPFSENVPVPFFARWGYDGRVPF